MNEKLESVKTYHLNGKEFKISFSMAQSEELELVYEDKKGRLEFTGREIFRDETQLGFLPSVILEEAPDSHRVLLSVAIPSANKTANQRSVPVKTVAIITTSRSSIAGPQILFGQIQTYDVHMLEGNAW